MTSQEVTDAHRAAGRFFEVGSVRSFVREEGRGEAVVCLHGVPTSSFLYRKVLRELSGRGLCGIAFDLPGLGMADRPLHWRSWRRRADMAHDRVEFQNQRLDVGLEWGRQEKQFFLADRVSPRRRRPLRKRVC